MIIGLIMHCVGSSSLSLIWNGKCLPNFSSTTGFRQGDSLPPYLFVIFGIFHGLAIQILVWRSLMLIFMTMLFASRTPSLRVNGSSMPHIVYFHPTLLSTSPLYRLVFIHLWKIVSFRVVIWLVIIHQRTSINGLLTTTTTYVSGTTVLICLRIGFGKFLLLRRSSCLFLEGLPQVPSYHGYVKS